MDCCISGIPSELSISWNCAGSRPDCLSISSILGSWKEGLERGGAPSADMAPDSSTTAAAGPEEEALPEDFFFFVAGTTFMTLPSSTPTFSKISDGFSFCPPNKTFCCSGLSPDCSSSDFCTSCTVDALSMVYFFPRRVT